MKSTAIILLAAGKSSRMGSPKQLLGYEGKYLLQRIVDTSLELFENNCIALVLGANHPEILREIDHKNILISINDAWESGMSSSIKSGLQTLLQQLPTLDRCIVSVCDQPHLTVEVLQEMINRADTSSKGIIAAGYAGTSGVPAIFSKKYFNELLALSGEQGAKKLIQKNIEDIHTISFEDGAVDIDTPLDYENLSN